MPFRLRNEGFPDRTKIQFTTAVWMPHRIYEACLATGVVSNTVYIQHAVCVALARDLGLDYDELIATLPAARTVSAHLFDPTDNTMDRYSASHRDIREDPTGGRIMVGPANTIEDVR